LSIELDDAFIEKLLEKLRENKEFARKLHYLLEDEFVRKVEIKEMLAELRRMREESEKRWEESNRRWEESNRRWEELREDFRERTKIVDKRFEQVDKRFEQVDKRFEQVDKRFEQVDKRFDQMDEKIDKGFAELSLGFGMNFEDLSQAIVKKIMDVLGIKLPKLEKRRFVDQKMTVHMNSTDVEVDLFSEEPLIIGEVSGSITELEKIERFIRKIHFLEEQFKKKATLKIIITYRIHPKLSNKVRAILKKEGIELIAIDD